MNVLVLTLVLQSVLLLPPRTALENPTAASTVSQKLRKDYDKLWVRFTTATNDSKLAKDLDKLLRKEKNFDPGWIIQGYIALYKGDEPAARAGFAQALTINPNNRIAMYYLAELAYARGEYARAASLYAQLISIDAIHPEIETKRQKAFLLATDDLLRAAARAESENRLSEAEGYYRQALKFAPNEPALHVRLTDLLLKANKKEEAETERKIAESLMPRPASRVAAADRAKRDDLEDLGRWGSDIEVFHKIRDTEVLTREQFAILIVRYFPQVTESRQTPQIITDIQDSAAISEIQVVTGIGLIQPLPNRAFEPSAPITRGDFAKALARLSRLLGVSTSEAPPTAPPDVASTSTLYPDVQLVLGSGVMTLQDSGSFEAAGPVSGRQAVRSADRLVRTFQQLQR